MSIISGLFRSRDKPTNSTSTDDIDAKLLELQKELLQKANNREDYDSIAEEIFQLRELKAKSETDSVIRDEKLSRITELCDYLKAQLSKITVFDESLVRRMLQKSPCLKTALGWNSNQA